MRIGKMDGMEHLQPFMDTGHQVLRTATQIVLVMKETLIVLDSPTKKVCWKIRHSFKKTQLFIGLRFQRKRQMVGTAMNGTNMVLAI